MTKSEFLFALYLLIRSFDRISRLLSQLNSFPIIQDIIENNSFEATNQLKALKAFNSIFIINTLEKRLLFSNDFLLMF